MGLGGLGHMAVKLAASMGAEVTVLSTSPAKEDDARRLGAHLFRLTANAPERAALANSFDLILNTVAASHDVGSFVEMLDSQGTMVILGGAPEPFELSAFSLILKSRRIAGSLIGGIVETQEMLDYCAKHRITSEVEIVPIQKIDDAYRRAVEGDVRYRFVIDLATLDPDR
jgi:uncharacterized zinc-type alcohol dehydrogenase-like protein